MTEYERGVTLKQPVAPHHGGGFYVCSSRMQLLQRHLLPSKSALLHEKWAVATVQGWGSTIHYEGKVSVEYIQPVDFHPFHYSGTLIPRGAGMGLKLNFCPARLL